MTSRAQYVAPLTIGSDQQFNIIFDTGSTDLFLPAAGAGPHNTVQADPAITPYNGGGVQCTEAYGGRNQGIVGQIYDAPYSLAGSNADVSSTFCLVSDEGSFSSPADGILGLGFCNGGSVATQTGNCPLAALEWTSFGVFTLVLVSFSFLWYLIAPQESICRATIQAVEASLPRMGLMKVSIRVILLLVRVLKWTVVTSIPYSSD